ncbi:hypothetical protein ACIBVL_26510 [Streptomyces sp. NPDC049687]|uniref:hypothetical protein n=1 Tax=Streptomyces sp. NPDC049687 TaxID=3365596 RepID=UPI0037B38339
MVLGSDRRRGKARRGSGPRAAGRGTALAAALVLVLAPALAACSDDGGGGGAGTAPMTSSAPAATAPADPAAAEQQIRQNWQKFFDPASSTEDKLAVLENGERMGPVLQAFGGDRRGGQVAAKVEKVEFTRPTEATVTYTLTLDGATALPHASGRAVQQEGTWKVSVTTLCALVQLSGNESGSAVPGC